MERSSRERQIQAHLDAIRRLQAERAEQETQGAAWPPDGYYLLWHVLVGVVLGGIGAAVSLGLNALGALLVGRAPLDLIRVYLTFPMGERALHAQDGLVLTVGCILYLITGGLYGIAFHLVMSSVFADAGTGKRFLVGSMLGLGLWIVNFYLVLSWLQPLLLGGNWIITEVPFWVAALTHLAFAWTILACQTWSRFDPSTHRS